MILARQHGARSAIFARDGMPSMPTHVVKRIDVALLVSDQEEIVAQHFTRHIVTCFLKAALEAGDDPSGREQTASFEVEDLSVPVPSRRCQIELFLS